MKTFEYTIKDELGIHARPAELEENQRIRLLTDGPVKAGDPLFAIEILA